MASADMKKTYCFELLSAINSGVQDLTLVDAKYTADSLVAVVEDKYNHQRYELTLRPLKGQEVNL